MGAPVGGRIHIQALRAVFAPHWAGQPLCPFVLGVAQPNNTIAMFPRGLAAPSGETYTNAWEVAANTEFEAIHPNE